MDQHILIIDDSPDTHALLKVRLRAEGLALHSALSPEEGLRMVRELSVDLVLLDLDMPGTSGFELCSMLKSDPCTQAVPIIFLTGTTDTEAKVRGFDLGATDYVTKPFEPNELRARVRAALRTKRYQDLLSTRAQIDGLTGLWNRSYFDARIAEVEAAHLRYGQLSSLILIDVDHFKRINDDFGHPFGDRVLQRVAGALADTMRTTDVLCRYGGEEFVVVCPHTPMEGAFQAAERMREQVAALSIDHRTRPVAVSASFGVASTQQTPGEPEMTTEALLRLADRALYEAKRQGRNRVCHALRGSLPDLPPASSASAGSVPEQGQSGRSPKTP